MGINFFFLNLASKYLSNPTLHTHPRLSQLGTEVKFKYFLAIIQLFLYTRDLQLSMKAHNKTLLTLPNST